MLLESSDLDFMFPHFVVELDVVEDGVDEALNVWVLVTEELKDDCDHLGLVEHDVSCWREEQELEEGVENLLHHFIVFLLGSEEVLQHLDKV